MEEKEKYLNNVCPNIKFIECDITNIELLKEKKLDANGGYEKQPCILILEGISHYLTEYELRNVLKFFAAYTSHLAFDFGISPGFVDEQNRMIGVDIVNKIVPMVGIDFMNFFRPNFFMKLIKECGFTIAQRVTMTDMQAERTGSITPFEGHEAAWVEIVRN